MTVHVTNKDDIPFLSKVLDELFGVLNGGVQNFGGHLPAAVEVSAEERAAIVAVDDAIGVQHGHYFDDKGFTEHVGFA